MTVVSITTQARSEGFIASIRVAPARLSCFWKYGSSDRTEPRRKPPSQMRRYFVLPPAHPPIPGQPFQQLAQRVFLDPGGGRSVSDCHFLLSLPEKTGPS